MRKNGPIVVIEDDPDDRELIEIALNKLKLPNEIVMFGNGQKGFDYLSLEYVKPLVVISDINMPGLNGLDLRDKLFIDVNLRKRAVPFLFFTTSSDANTINRAYDSPIQGIFSKPSTISGFEEIIKLMIDYWGRSLLL